MRRNVKKWLTALMLFSMALFLAGCAGASYTQTEVAVEETEEKDDTNTIGKTEETRAEGEAFTMSVTCGYGRYAKYGRDMGIQAEITNHGGDFAGELWVMLPNNNSGSLGTLYKKEFAIAAGETKKVEVVVPVLFSTGKIHVSIRDEEEKEWEETNVKVNVRGNTDILYVGVLSDNYTDLSYFTDTQTKTFLMEAENFPEDKRSLDMLDIIVINDFNTSIFNESQYESLKGFVEEGGSLVIGTGATGTKTLEGFKDDFITGTIGGTSKTQLTLGTENSQVEKELLAVSLDNSIPSCVEEDFVLMEKVAVGKGNIQLFTFDLALENSNWNTMGKYIVSKVTDNLSDAKRSQIRGEQDGSSFYLLENCLEVTSGENVPAVGRYAVVLLIYLLLIGPLLYVILKKLDKRNYTWIIVPGLAVVFSLLIYGMGTDTRLSKPYVRYLTFSHVKDGVESEELTFSLTAPYNNAYEVVLPSEYDITLPVMNYYYDYNSQDTTKNLMEYDISVGYGAETTTLGIRNHGAFEPAYFSASSVKDAEGSVESDISLKEDEKGGIVYTGTVTNHLGYDLQSAILAADGRCYLIGDIANGETKSIDGCKFYTVFSQDAVWNSGLITQAVGGDPWSQGSNTSKIRQYYALEYKLTKDTKDIRRENYLLGFTEDSGNPVVDAIGLKNEGIKLVTAVVDVDYQLAENEVYIPYLDEDYVIVNGEYDQYYRYIYSENLELEVHFEADEKISALIYPKDGNPENEPGSQWYGFYGTVSAFNYETGVYEIIFESGKPAEFSELEAYLNEENVMRLMFDIDDGARNQYSISIPVLSAVKEAR